MEAGNGVVAGGGEWSVGGGGGGGRRMSGRETIVWPILTALITGPVKWCQ